MALRPQSLAFTFLIGALAALPPLSIDLGLPALNLLESSLGASHTQAALTLSLFLVGFGLSQLVMGPLSDRHGRRPVMLAGMTLYALAGLGCALSTSIEALLAFRLLAGIGAAGGTTLAMAVVRDSFEGQAGRIKMSQVSMVITMALADAVLVAAVWLGLAESRPPLPGARLDLVGRYAAVFQHRRTMGYVLVNTLGSGGLFAFIAGSPMLLMGTMGVSTAVFGLLFATTSSGILLGSTINNILARRGVGARAPLAVGLSLGPLAALGAALVTGAGIVSVATFIPFVVVVGICRGLTTPNITHAALEPVPHHAGVTAALMGAGQMLCMAVASVVVAEMHDDYGALGVALTMLGFLSAGLISWLLVERAVRQGRLA